MFETQRTQRSSHKEPQGHRISLSGRRRPRPLGNPGCDSCRCARDGQAGCLSLQHVQPVVAVGIQPGYSRIRGWEFASTSVRKDRSQHRQLINVMSLWVLCVLCALRGSNKWLTNGRSTNRTQPAHAGCDTLCFSGESTVDPTTKKAAVRGPLLGSVIIGS